MIQGGSRITLAHSGLKGIYQQLSREPHLFGASKRQRFEQYQPMVSIRCASLCTSRGRSTRLEILPWPLDHSAIPPWRCCPSCIEGATRQRRTSQGDGNCPRSPRGPAGLDRYPSVARNPPKHPPMTRPGACPRCSSLPMVRSHPQVHLETESPEGRKSRGR